jgi:ribosome-interacting GTPase 1
VLDEDSLERLRQTVWRLTGLQRVHLRDGGDPIAFRPPVSVLDVAHAIHHELGERCRGARVWGASVRFPGRRAGCSHALADGDTVEVLER